MVCSVTVYYPLVVINMVFCGIIFLPIILLRCAWEWTTIFNIYLNKKSVIVLTLLFTNQFSKQFITMYSVLYNSLPRIPCWLFSHCCVFFGLNYFMFCTRFNGIWFTFFFYDGTFLNIRSMISGDISILKGAAN